MATIYELGVQIGDLVSLPIKNPGEEGYDPEKRHTAKIVGPPAFPNCNVIFLAPPRLRPGANVSYYVPASDKTRSIEEFTGYDRSGRKIWTPSEPRQGEILAQEISAGYSEFHRE